MSSNPTAADPTTVVVAGLEGVVQDVARDGRFVVEAAFAREIAVRAGELLMERYERVERVDYKSARDIVTEVDHLSEALIVEAIRTAFPADGILAEESGSVGRADGTAATAPGGRTWVVDPLDGTVNYANGIPFFCVSVALVVDGTPAVGVVHDPCRGDTFEATADGPATLDGRPIRVSTKERLTDFVVSLALGGRGVAGRLRTIRRAIRIPRSMGSAALALAYVGNGRFDAFIQSSGLSVWDVAAAGLVAERGGARLTTPEGGPWFDLAAPPKSFGLVAAPPEHHAAILALVRGDPRRPDPSGTTPR
ncbi:MAG TPA: inositol monophosphatase family protein [Candidatus Binatia bacterium]|nr:inositol monophosphatase family protein [Candidatus Binatia bacterium]